MNINKLKFGSSLLLGAGIILPSFIFKVEPGERAIIFN